MAPTPVTEKISVYIFSPDPEQTSGRGFIVSASMRFADRRTASSPTVQADCLIYAENDAIVWERSKVYNKRRQYERKLYKT